MEFFAKSNAVKLRSYIEKYLIADNDGETVRQSRNGDSRKAIWIIERVENNNYAVRLKSCFGKYLTTSDSPFLLGMTGKKAFQTFPDKTSEASIQWEPIRDGFQLKLRMDGWKYLRANGGSPPWRNSVTVDSPRAGVTSNWLLWDVEAVDMASEEEASEHYLSSLSSFSDEVHGAEIASSPKVFSKRSGMDLFRNAKAVRLRSHHDKYLLAEEDEESVTQDRDGSSKNGRWMVEFVANQPNVVRLKSCYNKYLTASNQPFLLGMTGRKVTQTTPTTRLDSSVEWEPIREGHQVKLKTRYGQFLRANGGLPPWRNSITHDIPHRTATKEWVLWDVDIVEIQVRSPGQKPEFSFSPVARSDSFASESSSPSSVSVTSAAFSRQESSDSLPSSPPKMEGRTIYYHVADEGYGDNMDEETQGYALCFKGNGVEDLTRRLEKETGLENITVCSHSPLNGKLYPLRLQLPPNNVTMNVVVVPSSSKRDFIK